MSQNTILIYPRRSVYAILAVVQSLGILSTTYSSNDRFEEPPTLRANDILPDSLLSGPNHDVRDEVPVVRYGYHFTLDTKHGEIEVWSKNTLNRQIRELAAIEKLNDISQTKAFVTSITEAAKNPLMGAWKIATNPESTIKGIPSGATRYLKGAYYKIRKGSADVTEIVAEVSENVADIGSKKPKEEQSSSMESLAEQASEATSDATKEHLGFNKAKRDWAKRMKVDPYSENVILQQSLERIAWATAIGSFAADTSIPSYDPLDYANEVQDLVWDTPPLELERQNDERLRKIGISEESIREFHGHSSYRASTKTALTFELNKLDGVNGLDQILDVVLEASESHETTMMVELVSLLSNYHESELPLDRIEITRGLITAIDTEGTTILPIAIEYLHWTPVAEEIAADALFAKKSKELWITGNVSDVSRERLAELGWETTESCFEYFQRKKQ